MLSIIITAIKNVYPNSNWIVINAKHFVFSFYIYNMKVISELHTSDLCHRHFISLYIPSEIEVTVTLIFHPIVEQFYREWGRIMLIECSWQFHCGHTWSKQKGNCSCCSTAHVSIVFLPNFKRNSTL